MMKRFDFMGENNKNRDDKFYKFSSRLLYFIIVFILTITVMSLTAFTADENDAKKENMIIEYGVNDDSIIGDIACDSDIPNGYTPVYKSHAGELTIGGAIEEPFNFEKNGSGKEYLFAINNPPTDFKEYLWSVGGALPAGLSLMNATNASAYIGGTPTEITDGPVSITVSVRATAENGDEYYGTVDVLIKVYVPENPFVKAEALLKAAACTVPMTSANTANDVSIWLHNVWFSGIYGLSDAFGDEFDISMLSVVLDDDFISAKAGNASDPDGTDGKVTFNVNIDGENSLCENLICTVKATVYNHTHSFSDTYGYDVTHHWYECTDPECNESNGKELHVGTDDGDCTTAVVCVCGYVITSATNHNLSGGYEHNPEEHWQVCINDGCEFVGVKEAHTYATQAICEVCGQPYDEKNADTTLPTGSIRVGTDTWSELQSDITFLLFYKVAQKVTVTAYDAESGVSTVEYFLSDRKLENFGSVVWTEYTESFDIEAENTYVIYVRITDKAGNAVFISSNGITIDNTAPMLSGIENGKTYCVSVEVTVVDKNISTVIKNGDSVSLSNGKFTLIYLDKNQTITATDRAGNSTTCTITVNSAHTVTDTHIKIDENYHGQFCSVCNSIPGSGRFSHTYNNVSGKNICSKCGYEQESGLDIPITVYNDPDRTDSTVYITGAGLSNDDLLITESEPQGSAYEALQRLADSGDIFATYNIYLKSGNKTGSNMHLTFDLDAEYAGQDFTIVHEKSNGTYEYFYDTADAIGDLTFGPLYELSPFMLVKGTLLPPSESDSIGGSHWIWASVLLLSGGAVAAIGITLKRKKVKGK